MKSKVLNNYKYYTKSPFIFAIKKLNSIFAP
ncbi:hypothetical protein KL86DYS2_11165 [uncultured Dysgonomonas sp.]|uniref:Uncharacterized protein n=1 Tax=uncultured Dysgonomonas sp. TaxID=206096 RepID=A0A212JC57_9BACT|nr:hypothetical protein KL86DYS2_11165 [uncultured Dysgonomonas sp.]